MYLPKSVLFYTNDRPHLFEFSLLRKKIFAIAVGWTLFVAFMVFGVVGINVYIENSSLKSLRTHYESAQQESQELKQVYNRLAKTYLEEQKIARIVGYVNHYLDEEHVDLWVTERPGYLR